MERASLELKIISCKDLKAFSCFKRLRVYVVVSIHDDQVKRKRNQREQCQRTEVDSKGGRNPEWNHTLRFDVESRRDDDINHLFLRFKLCCQGFVFGRSIGKVHVPLKNLIDADDDDRSLNASHVRYVSYQVRDSDDKPNGVLNFAYSNLSIPKKMKVDKKIDSYVRPCSAPFVKVHRVQPGAETVSERSAKQVSPSRMYPSLELDAPYLSPMANPLRSPPLYPSVIEEGFCVIMPPSKASPSPVYDYRFGQVQWT